MSSIFDRYLPYLPSSEGLQLTQEQEAVFNNTDAITLAELLHAKLVEYIDQGMGSTNVKNALYKTEEALLTLEHRRQRRALDGVYTLPVPDAMNTFDVLNRIQQAIHVEVKFYHDSPSGSSIVNVLTLDNVFVSDFIGLVKGLVSDYLPSHRNQRIFKPFIEHYDEIGKSLVLGLVIVDTGDNHDYMTNIQQHYDTTIEKIKENLKEKKVGELTLYDIVSHTHWSYPKVFTNAEVSQAFYAQNLMHQTASLENQEEGFGLGSLVPGVYLFRPKHATLDELQVKVTEALDKYLEDHTH